MENGIGFEELQYKEGITTYRELYRLLVQILNVFFVADITILGFSIQYKWLSLAILSTAFPFAMFVVLQIVRSRMIPIIYECVRFELRRGTEFGLLWKYQWVVENKNIVKIARENLGASNDEQTRNAYVKIRGNIIYNFIRHFTIGPLSLYLLFHLAIIAVIQMGNISLLNIVRSF